MARASVPLSLDRRRTATRCKVGIHTGAALCVPPAGRSVLPKVGPDALRLQTMAGSGLGLEAQYRILL